MDPRGPERWAVYFAPPADHPLWHIGCAWLGRDPEGGRELVRPACALDPDTIAVVTAGPARYGFHATLKPPFVLAPGRDAEALADAVRVLAARHAPFAAPTVAPTVIGGFRALTFTAPCPAMEALAAACVRDLDPFRAPPTEAELASRRAAGLSQRQSDLLTRWGYPYVLEEFRFHMTLTERLDGAMVDAAIVDDAVDALFGAFATVALPVRDLALYRQPDRAAPFRLVTRFPLTGQSR